MDIERKDEYDIRKALQEVAKLVVNARNSLKECNTGHRECDCDCCASKLFEWDEHGTCDCKKCKESMKLACEALREVGENTGQPAFFWGFIIVHLLDDDEPCTCEDCAANEQEGTDRNLSLGEPSGMGPGPQEIE